MSKKLSSYQKLKAEIARLRAENHILLDNENHLEIHGMRMCHQMKKDIQKAIDFGNPTTLRMGGVFGIMESFSKHVDPKDLDSDDPAFRTDFKNPAE